MPFVDIIHTISLKILTIILVKKTRVKKTQIGILSFLKVFVFLLNLLVGTVPGHNLLADKSRKDF